LKSLNKFVLFFDRSDAKRLFSFNGSNQEILEQLRHVTAAEHVVTTLSSEGLIAWNGESYHQIPAREVIILDRIGAGDALVGGVLHGYLQGDFVKGLRYGVTCAAMALSQYGDQLVTNKEELEGLMDVEAADITR
jgi:2-dehydro-3-deoxygluconokinase